MFIIIDAQSSTLCRHWSVQRQAYTHAQSTQSNSWIINKLPACSLRSPKRLDGESIVLLFWLLKVMDFEEKQTTVSYYCTPEFLELYLGNFEITDRPKSAWVATRESVWGWGDIAWCCVMLRDGDSSCSGSKTKVRGSNRWWEQLDNIEHNLD